MAPVPIRAHNLLCLLGYRGKGYSEGFIERMTDVHRALTASPDTPVQVLVRPDRICDACPHLHAHGCTLGGRGHEAHMRAQDLAVAKLLGLEEGSVHPWRDLLARIAQHVRGADLPAICTTCPWLGLGWCAEGVEGVRTAHARDHRSEPPTP